MSYDSETVSMVGFDEATDKIDPRQMATEKHPEAVKPVPTSVHIVEGELLPWKGHWFRLHLTKHEGVYALELLKPTERAQRLMERTQRWQRQHPKATQGKRT